MNSIADCFNDGLPQVENDNKANNFEMNVDQNSDRDVHSYPQPKHIISSKSSSSLEWDGLLEQVNFTISIKSLDSETFLKKCDYVDYILTPSPLPTFFGENFQKETE